MDPDTLLLLKGVSDNHGPRVRHNPNSSEFTSRLPESHVGLLNVLNGFTVADGALRLFGFRDEPHLDLAAWNDRETWRFAWSRELEPFFIFGETGWGDQYAYRRKENGREFDPEVYFLEAVLLTPVVVADSFDEFIHHEFLRNVAEPYDSMTRAVLGKLGPLGAPNHWTLSPPIALGGVEAVENVRNLPAIIAMVFAGDIASALRTSHPGSVPTGVTPWEDVLGRSRLRVEFD